MKKAMPLEYGLPYTLFEIPYVFWSAYQESTIRDEKLQLLEMPM